MGKILVIDRSVSFDPVSIGRPDFVISNHWPWNPGQKELDLEKIIFKEFGNIPHGDAWRHLDAKIAEIIFNAVSVQPDIIPDAWKEEVDGQPRYMFFLGTEMVFKLYSGFAGPYAVILYWNEGRLHMSYNYKDSDTWPKRKFAALV